MPLVYKRPLGLQLLREMSRQITSSRLPTLRSSGGEVCSEYESYELSPIIYGAENCPRGELSNFSGLSYQHDVLAPFPSSQNMPSAKKSQLSVSKTLLKDAGDASCEVIEATIQSLAQHVCKLLCFQVG